MSYEHTEKTMTARLPHSPAPFSLQPCTADNGKTSVICDSTDYVLARIDSAAWSDDAAQSDEVLQDRANALLLVAAPELLAALKVIVAWFDRTWDQSDMAIRARAAIAKAEGRE